MSKGAITSLLDAGADAFSNLYDVIITPPNILKDLYGAIAGSVDTVDGQNKLTVRALDFTPVTLDAGVHQIHYKSISIPVLTAKLENERRFTLTFRESSNYGLLKFFKEWKYLYVNPEQGITPFGAIGDSTALGPGAAAIANEDTDYFGSIKVAAYRPITASTSAATDTSTQLLDIDRSAALWSYSRVMAYKVNPPSFTREASNALTFSVDFLYAGYSEDIALI